MGEEQDGVGHVDSQATGVHVPASACLGRGHSDGRANERHEDHHDEGKEFTDGIEDAEHHEVHQEACVLQNVTI